MAVLLLDTGLRLGEALTLEPEHVDLEAMALRVVGKGQRVRLVPFPRKASCSDAMQSNSTT